MKRAACAEQLGFDALLTEADHSNSMHALEASAAHLPATMAESVPFLRALIKRHHAAMMAADIDAAMTLRKEAHLLAEKLNGFEPGILADDQAPGCVLDRKTRARKGLVPLWGQSGTFETTVGAMRVRIVMDGVFGIGASCTTYPGFHAHAVDWDAPFLSETGYRSFVGLSGTLTPNMTVDAFAVDVIARHVARHIKGRVLAIHADHRARHRSA